MKTLAFITLIILSVGCDPYGFGYKKNPAFVLDEAFKSISNLDTESFLEVSGKEVLCVYGNEKGMNFLKTNLTIDPESLKIHPKVLESKHFKIPRYVGYWSYYHERYQIEIEDKTKSERILKAIVDCEYGTDREKNEKFINLKPKKYRIKECRLVKMVPLKFSSLGTPSKCDDLRVPL